VGILGQGRQVADSLSHWYPAILIQPLPCFRINNGCPFRVAWEATRIDILHALFLYVDMAPSIVDIKSEPAASPWTLSCLKKSCRLARFRLATRLEDRVGSRTR